MKTEGAALAAPRARPAQGVGVATLLPDRLTTPLLLGAVGAAVAFPATLLATSSLVLALGAAVGVCTVLLAISDPLIAVLLYVGVEVSQAGAVLQQLGVPSPFVVTQLITIIALIVAFYQRRLRVVWSPVLLGALALLASRAASLPTSYDPSTALSTVATEARDLVTLLCVFVLLWMTSGTRNAIRVCVVVLGALAALTVVQEYVLNNSTEFLGLSQVNPPDVGSTSSRHLGPIGDPNFWGRVLLMYMPFAIALTLAARRRASRLGWAGASAALLVGIFLSQSRGAFLAAAVALLVFLLLAGWHYARWLALAPLLIALLFVVPATGQRLSTLADLRDASSGGGDLSLVLRLASQEAGLRMFADRPLLGVGAGNYTELTPQYERGLSFATVGELGRPLAPHNAYLEFAAEGGLVGVLGMATFLGTLFFCGARALRAAAKRGPPGRANMERLMAAAALAALSGWCVASVVLHVRQFRTLLVLCAVIACLDAARSRGPVLARIAPLTRQGRFVAPWAGLAILSMIGAGALAVTGGTHQERWHAEVVSVVTSRGADIGYLDAYHYDLLTRGQVVPTLAQAIARSDDVRDRLPVRESGVEVQTAVRTRPRSADVVLVLDGDDRLTVSQAARLLPIAGAQVVDSFELPFQLQPVPYDERQLALRSSLRLETLLLGGAVALLASMLIWGQLQVHHRAARAAARTAL